MKKLILTTAVSFIIITAGFAQTKELTGPKYKNAKPSEKYKGSSSLLIREKPNKFQGPQFKNFNPRKYVKIERRNIDLLDSIEKKTYETEKKEIIIYRRVETSEMKGKNTKGLKGPAYKNYKP